MIYSLTQPCFGKKPVKMTPLNNNPIVLMGKPNSERTVNKKFCFSFFPEVKDLEELPLLQSLHPVADENPLEIILQSPDSTIFPKGAIFIGKEIPCKDKTENLNSPLGHEVCELAERYLKSRTHTRNKKGGIVTEADETEHALRSLLPLRKNAALTKKLEQHSQIPPGHSINPAPLLDKNA